MPLKFFSRKKNDESAPPVRKNAKEEAPQPAQHLPGAQDFKPAPRDPVESDPLKRLYQLGRLNTILRDEAKWRAHPGGTGVVETVKRDLEQRMALVPAGSVTLALTLTGQPGASEKEFEVKPFLLDVHTVTNVRYQKFVEADGYDTLEFWPEEIWPHLIELKDQTGHPGPRFWRHGRHDARLADHPVVGVSWYEAQAFALWVGQRLPTEAEWQMASSWHINSSADLLRRFPWGDAMDNSRCNIWSSRQSGTVPVNTYPNGAAPNRVMNLVGNVWEWTDTEYTITDDDGRPIVGEMPMHVIRGGAFDTYFETQTTAGFRTGQLALSRSHNTGFRCAMELQDATWMNHA